MLYIIVERLSFSQKQSDHPFVIHFIHLTMNITALRLHYLYYIDMCIISLHICDEPHPLFFIKRFYTHRFFSFRPDSEKYYSFTELACQLNEMEEGIAPTDSRLRPDQRLMELGMWDEANIEKLRLEEKQRLKRKERNNTPSEDVMENSKMNKNFEKKILFH